MGLQSQPFDVVVAHLRGGETARIPLLLHGTPSPFPPDLQCEFRAKLGIGVRGRGLIAEFIHCEEVQQQSEVHRDFPGSDALQNVSEMLTVLRLLIGAECLGKSIYVY